MVKTEKLEKLEKDYNIDLEKVIDCLLLDNDEKLDVDYNVDVVAYGGVNKGIGIVLNKDTSLESNLTTVSYYDVMDIRTWKVFSVNELSIKKIGTIPAEIKRKLISLSLAKDAWERDFYNKIDNKAVVEDFNISSLTNYTPALLSFVGQEVAKESGLLKEPYIMSE